MGNGLVALGSRFRKAVFRVPALAYSAGNTVSVELPQGFLHRNVALRLSGSITLTGAAASVTGESPLGLIKKIELVGDGRKTIWTAAGRDLYRLCHLLEGSPGELVAPGLGIATHPISAALRIHHEAVRMGLPPDSYFDPRPYTKVELRVTWGVLADVVNGGAGSVDATTKIEVQVETTTEGVEMISQTRIIQYEEKNLAATTSDFRFEVPKVGLLAAMLIRTDADLAPVDTILNKINFVSDSSFKHMSDLDPATVQRSNAIEYQVFIRGGAASADHIPGYYFLDFIEDGQLSTALNTVAINTAELMLDVTKVTGTNVIRVTYLFFEPVIPAA